MNRALADRIGMRPGQRVLDAGCGVGGSALWLAREGGVEVVGVTLVASQVERARRFAAEVGMAERVTFALDDYASRSFPAGAFDAARHLGDGERLPRAGETAPRA